MAKFAFVLLSITSASSLFILTTERDSHTQTHTQRDTMAAESLPSALMETSASFVNITDPAHLALLSSENGSASLSVRLLAKLIQMANGILRHSNGTLVSRRLSDLIEYKVPASEVPDRRGVSSKDVVIDTKAGVWMRVFLPPSPSASPPAKDVANSPVKLGDATQKKRRVIFYFHGGGFSVLSADVYAYDFFCRRLCGRSEAVVISVNYRRSPEHRYPVAYDDCYSALEWLEEFNGELFEPHKLDLSQCVLMGDSAGANIVHHVGSRWGARHPRSQKLHVDAHVLLFPFFGGEERTPAELRLERNALLVSVENSDWHWRAYLPPGSNRDHPACNVLGPNAPDLSSLPLPRSLVTISEFDMLKDWQLRYAQGLGRASKPVRLHYYTGGVHCFHILGDGNRSARLLSDIMSFIEDGGSKGGVLPMSANVGK